jgi:hypothetical protein
MRAHGLQLATLANEAAQAVVSDVPIDGAGPPFGDSMKQVARGLVEDGSKGVIEPPLLQHDHVGFGL